ncbi:MAG: TMEM43 family protein [Gemmataceae bacterium]
MADSYSKVTSTSWFERLGKSVGGVIVGVILFIASFPLLFWNEGRAVKTAKGLAEGAANTVDVTDIATVNPANNGKLVHLSGLADTQDTLTDSMFGISLVGIKLSRDVEMYQWVEEKKTETRKKLGGGEETVTTYNYTKKWTARPVDSSQFDTVQGHENPSWPFGGNSWVADDVRLGAYQLSPSLVSMISGAQRIPLKPDMVDKVEDSQLKSRLRVINDYFFLPTMIGGSMSSPQIGDMRISFSAIKPSTVSILAKQVNNTFEPYTTSYGTTINDLRMGTLSASEMYAQLQRENTIMTWVLRLVGFLLMGFGLSMVFQPLVVLADVIPLLGDLVSMGIGLFAFGIAFVLSLTTIAIGWVFYRPVLGITLLVIAVTILGSLIWFGHKRRAAAVTAG